MKKILIAVIFFCVTASCNDFVDVIPKGNTIPETVDDLAKLMTCGSMSSPLYTFSDISYSIQYFEFYSDDYTAIENPNSSNYDTYFTLPIFQNTLKWADYIYANAESDYNWDGLYKSNYVANYVLDKIDVVENGVAYDRNDVKGQALVHRAMNYFLLVNLYGKQYDAATASTDLGVPLVLEADINKQYPRATVAQVYERMLQDLNDAISLLKVDAPEYNNIPGKATAYALRARYYLWQQNYDQAYADAIEALKLRGELIDYNNCSLRVPGMIAAGVNGYESIMQINPEIMYSRYRMSRSNCPFSSNMLAIIDTDNDLRYCLFYGTYEEAGIFVPMSWTRHVHSGINTSEVWLTKAEAALRKSQPNVSEAIDALDYVRRHRYVQSFYQETTETNPDLFLTEILNERRREITFTEMAFLDRKRLNADPATARPMTRTVYGETYTLPVGDVRYQLAIPLNVMELNPQLIQNER